MGVKKERKKRRDSEREHILFLSFFFRSTHHSTHTHRVYTYAQASGKTINNESPFMRCRLYVCNAFAWKKFSLLFSRSICLNNCSVALILSRFTLCCAALHLCVCACECVCVCLSNSSCSFRINSLVLKSSWREKQGKMPQCELVMDVYCLLCGSIVYFRVSNK